jgi:hypothetical protein
MARLAVRDETLAGRIDNLLQLRFAVVAVMVAIEYDHRVLPTLQVTRRIGILARTDGTRDIASYGPPDAGRDNPWRKRLIGRRRCHRCGSLRETNHRCLSLTLENSGDGPFHDIATRQQSHLQHVVRTTSREFNDAIATIDNDNVEWLLSAGLAGNFNSAMRSVPSVRSTSVMSRGWGAGNSATPLHCPRRGVHHSAACPRCCSPEIAADPKESVGADAINRKLPIVASNTARTIMAADCTRFFTDPQ